MGKPRGDYYAPRPLDDRKNTARHERSLSPQSSHPRQQDHYSKRRRIENDISHLEHDRSQSDLGGAPHRDERDGVRFFGRGESYRPARTTGGYNDHNDSARRRPLPREADVSRVSEPVDCQQRNGRTRDQRASPKPRSQTAPKSGKSKSEKKSLSDKIHSLKNLLSHPNSKMPADVRQEKERELAGYLADQQRKLAKKELNATLQRYHFVRFMERRKAERRLQQLVKNGLKGKTQQESGTVKLKGEEAAGMEVSDDDDDGGGVSLPDPQIGGKESDIRTEVRSGESRDQLTERIHEAEVDLNYTLFAPLDQKYISLFASTPKSATKGSTKGNAEDDIAKDITSGLYRNACGLKPPMWYQVEKSMADGTLEELRKGRLGPGLGPLTTSAALETDVETAKIHEAVPERAGLKRGPSWMDDDEMRQEDLDSDMSDGGFFE